MGFFRLLLFFLIGYYIFRFVSGLFKPKKRPQSKFNRQYSNNRKEGDVVINVDPKTKKGKHIPKDDGDYVDYEEV